jgi:hypothetical protein
MSNKNNGKPIKSDKKTALKTPKEKKEAKRQKKIEKNNNGGLIL